VVLLVEALHCKPEGREFDYRWITRIFIHLILPVDSASNKKEYEGYLLGLEATGA